MSGGANFEGVKVTLILPALTEAQSPLFRPIKYSLFPPLGLATLAAYLRPEDDVVLQDEHVERLDLDDEPELGRGAATRSPTTTGAGARTSSSAACT